MSGPRPELPADIALRVRKARVAGNDDAAIEARLRAKYGMGLEAVPFADVEGGASSAVAPSAKAQRLEQRRAELGMPFGPRTPAQEAERRATIHGLTLHLDNVLRAAWGAATGTGTYRATKDSADAEYKALTEQFPKATGPAELVGRVAAAMLLPGSAALTGAIAGGVPAAADGESAGDIALQTASGAAAGKVAEGLTDPQFMGKVGASAGAVIKRLPGASKVSGVARDLKDIWSTTGPKQLPWLLRGVAPVADDVAPAAPTVIDDLETVIQRGLAKAEAKAAEPAVPPAPAPPPPPVVEAPPPVPVATPAPVPAPVPVPEVAPVVAPAIPPKLTLTVAKDGQLAVTISKMGLADLEREIVRRSAPDVIEANRAWLETAMKDLARRQAASAGPKQAQRSAAWLAKRNAKLGLK